MSVNLIEALEDLISVSAAIHDEAVSETLDVRGTSLDILALSINKVLDEMEALPGFYTIDENYN